MACVVGRTRISLSVTRCGRLMAKAMTSAMSCAGIPISAVGSSAVFLLPGWVMWAANSVAMASGFDDGHADVGLELDAEGF